MQTTQHHSYSLTRGLGGLFIFASFQFLENDWFGLMAVSLAVGVLNMLPHLWTKRWTSIIIYSTNTLLSAIIFYQFIQLGTRYLQWLWLALFIYYVIRLRDLFRKGAAQEALDQKDVILNENQKS